MILFIHSFQVLNTLSSMVLTAVNADVGGHFNLVIGLLVFRRRRLDLDPLNVQGIFFKYAFYLKFSIFTLSSTSIHVRFSI